MVAAVPALSDLSATLATISRGSGDQTIAHGVSRGLAGAIAASPGRGDRGSGPQKHGSPLSVAPAGAHTVVSVPIPMPYGMGYCLAAAAAASKIRYGVALRGDICELRTASPPLIPRHSTPGRRKRKPGSTRGAQSRFKPSVPATDVLAGPPPTRPPRCRV
jgi:hypothetical protein